jgi:hypothetical protein
VSNLAYARPAGYLPARTPLRSVGHPHIQIVTTRAQRSARPKVAYAVLTAISLFAIFGAQLLLSIVVSDGAYQIAALQTQQKELARTQQDLIERLDLRNATQHLAASAAALGMVPGSRPQFLDITTGSVTSAPGTIDSFGCGGACNLVANSLLGGMPLINPKAVTAQSNTMAPAALISATVLPATPSVVPATPGVVTALPAPVTH